MNWLLPHIQRVYARNAEGDGYYCNVCNLAATIIRVDVPDHYVCETCYQIEDAYGLHNCYNTWSGLLTGELPGAVPATIQFPTGEVDQEAVYSAVVGTWHAGNAHTASLGKLLFRIARINGEEVAHSATARDILYHHIGNVLTWIPHWKDGMFSVCMCCNPTSRYFGKTFVYHFATENVIWAH